MNTNITALQEILTDLHEAISQGNYTDQALMEQLNRIRKLAFDHLQQGAEVDDEILDRYYNDAVDQSRRFVELTLEAMKGGRVPPMTLINLVYCAELFANKVHRFFHLRNLHAIRELNGSLS